MTIEVKGTEALGSFSNLNGSKALTIPAGTTTIAVIQSSRESYLATQHSPALNLGGLSFTLQHYSETGNQASTLIWYLDTIAGRSDDTLDFSSNIASTSYGGVVYLSGLDPAVDALDDWNAECGTCNVGTPLTHAITQPADDQHGRYVSIVGLGADSENWNVSNLTSIFSSTALTGQVAGAYAVDTAPTTVGYVRGGLGFWSGAAGIVVYEGSKDFTAVPDSMSVVVTMPSPTPTVDENAYLFVESFGVEVTMLAPVPLLTYPRVLPLVGVDIETPSRVAPATVDDPVLSEVNGVPTFTSLEGMLSSYSTHLVVAEEITSPPETVWTEDGTDWVYEEPE